MLARPTSSNGDAEDLRHKSKVAQVGAPYNRRSHVVLRLDYFTSRLVDVVDVLGNGRAAQPPRPWYEERVFVDRANGSAHWIEELQSITE